MKIGKTMLVFCLLAPACGPGDLKPDTDTKSPPPADLGQDEGSNGDPWNCGELGLKCVGPLGIGECIDGECQASLSGCHPPPGNCNTICESIGRTCAELECEGATAWVWNAPTLEEANALCVIPDHETVQPLAVTCDQELEDLATTVNCCCHPK